MNKTEKLLAARKKLKEFQLNKNNHTQITSHSHHGKEESITENNDRKEGDYQNSVKNMDNNKEVIDNTYDNSDIKDLHNISRQKDVEIKFYENNILTKLHSNSLDCIQNIPENSEISITTEDNSIDHNLQLENRNGESIENETILQKNSNSFVQKYSIPPLMAFDYTNNNEKKLSFVKNVLEHQDQFLTTSLKDEPFLFNQLNIELNKYKEKVLQLESYLSMKDIDLKTKILEQTNPLHEQIQCLTQTTNILVAEKAHLTSLLTQTEAIVQQKTNEVVNLMEKLKLTQRRISELEEELSRTKNITDEIEKIHQQLEINNKSLNYKYTELQKISEEQKMEIAEIRQELNIKSEKLQTLSRELQEKKNSLSFAELKIQQLSNASQEMQVIENQNISQAVLEEQIAQLKEDLKIVTIEKQELCKHYDSYVKQLDTKYECIIQELKSSQTTIHDCKESEENYIQRLSLLEQQYQREKQKVESLLPLRNYEDQIKQLTQSIDSFVLEQEILQNTLRDKDTEIEAFKEKLKELSELQNKNVEISKLVSALESEQFGASRAASQNEQLKFQLSEMHDAFVTLSNSKLNLTEHLQDERSVGRKLNKELNRVENERDKLKEELIRKDEIITDLEKEKFQSAQIADQMQHYQAQSYQTRTLQQELQNALNSIALLKSENSELVKKLERLNSTNCNMKETSIANIENKIIEVECICEKETRGRQIDPDDVTSEPLMKLEKRFKETIDRVAELTDEKQGLEHLVLQLQGETETIGEYVTLYQKQRAILQMKAQEREQTFRQLIDQRNLQQTQLHQLKVLVANLLKKNNESIIKNNKENDLAEHVDEAGISNVVNREILNNESGVPEVNEKNETTAKILELLTEIKDCKDTCSLEPNFHPCLWCSGKLITV